MVIEWEDWTRHHCFTRWEISERKFIAIIGKTRQSIIALKGGKLANKVHAYHFRSSACFPETLGSCLMYLQSGDLVPYHCHGMFLQENAWFAPKTFQTKMLSSLLNKTCFNLILNLFF